MEDQGIGWAIEQLWDAKKVTRAGWNGPGQYLALQLPDNRSDTPRSDMTLPYIYITTVQGDRVPWHASQTDILAIDWMVVL